MTNAAGSAADPPNIDNLAVPGSGATTLITNPSTVQVMRLFDLSYETMLLMLNRYFADTDESQTQMIGLQQAVFFPMMTIIMRPLGEILTQLPAFVDGSAPRAGPSFTFDRRLTMLPHRNAAWQNLRMQLDRMRHIAAELAQSTAFPQPIGERLQLIYENVSRIQMYFDNAMLLRGDHDER
jgi:hypothetical protein